MNLFDKLFMIFGAPPEGEALVYWWIWMLFGIAVIFFSYLVFKSRKLSRIIEKRQLESNADTRPLIEAYKSSFTEIGGKARTSESAEEYLNDYSLLHSTMQWNLLENVPNILVGLGILGTFVGLTNGIVGISFEDTNAIQESIQVLLAGMGMAFVTSIWGMGLSIFFSFGFKIVHQGIIRDAQRLTTDLDREHKINQGDLSNFRFQEQRTLLNNLFDDYLVDEVDGHRQLPKNVFRQLLQESTQQSRSLNTLADDLGRAMEEFLDTVLASNNEAISRLIEEKLVPVLEELKGIKEDSSAEVIERIVTELSNGMQSMLEEFKTSVTGETKKEMDELAIRLTEVSHSLMSVPETMKATTEGVFDTLEVMKELITESVMNAKEQQTAQQDQLEGAMTRINNNYESNMEALQFEFDRMLKNQRENIEQTSKLVTQYERVVSENEEAQYQFRQLIEKSNAVVVQIDGVANKFTGHSDKLNGASAVLELSSQSLRQCVDNFIKENNSLVANQQNAAELMHGLLKEYSERFQVIEQGLTSVFGDLQEGLEEYQLTTAGNLNKYLGQFSEAYTEALTSTKSSIGQLNESVEELAEVFHSAAKRA